MHSVLSRQLKRAFGSLEDVPAGLEGLLAAVEAHYRQADSDRVLLDRALEISSRELSEANSELRSVLQNTQAILTSAGEGICGLSATGAATLVNPEAARMLGWDADDLTGRNLHELVLRKGADAKECPCGICAALGGETTALFQSGSFLRRDGSCFPVEYSAVPILDSGGTPEGAVVTFRNVERRLLLEAQLGHIRKLESIGQLAAGIAHEINTPIQFVGDNLMFLRDSFADIERHLGALIAVRECAATSEDVSPAISASKQVEADADIAFLLAEIPTALEQCKDGLARVARIVRAMKDFSHPGSEEKTLADINQAIRSTVVVASHEHKYVADVVLDLDPGLPLVPCSPGDLNQVFLNLVVNAAHAIADRPESADLRGTITVSTHVVENEVEVRVTDTGVGIPAAISSRVFDPFFTTKPVGRGTGQGLALAHSIVVGGHGGSIAFDSEVGKGTTFRVRLPTSCDAPTLSKEAA